MITRNSKPLGTWAWIAAKRLMSSLKWRILHIFICLQKLIWVCILILSSDIIFPCALRAVVLQWCRKSVVHKQSSRGTYWLSERVRPLGASLLGRNLYCPSYPWLLSVDLYLPGHPTIHPSISIWWVTTLGSRCNSTQLSLSLLLHKVVSVNSQLCLFESIYV